MFTPPPYLATAGNIIAYATHTKVHLKRKRSSL